MGKTRKQYRGRRKMASKVRQKKTNLRVEDETVENVVNIPGVAPNEAHSQENISASAKKFQVFGVTLESGNENIIPSDEPDKMSDAYFLAQQKCISMLLSKLLCPTCGLSGVSFQVIPEGKCGFAAKAKITCRNCDEICGTSFLCERVGNSQSQNIPFDINVRATLAFRGIGCGFSAMKEWSGMMNMPFVLTQNSYIEHNNKLEEGSRKAFNQIGQETTKEIFKAYSAVGVQPDDQGILDIAVSYDGAWQRRGFSSHNGVGSVIDLLTGLPVDFEVLSNFCSKCATKTNSDQHWEEKHKPSCSKNYEGSSGSMEVECALRIWKRSIEEHSLRYTIMLSDGDSKAYDAVSAANVYGVDVLIEKEDCINHVAKRMGTALRKLASVSKAQKTTITGKGKLTNMKIKKIQNYYGKAIKLYSSDVPLLQKRIMGILLHLSSTDEQPKHAHCPPGESSWCFWQRAIASSKEPGSHKGHETLPVEIGKKLVPIFQRLSDPKLLNRCSRNMTQNANEALHSILWKIVPKSVYVGRKTMQTAMALAVCKYAMGASFQIVMCRVMELEPGKILKETAKKKDLKRLKRAEKAASAQAKKRRKLLKYNQLKETDTKKSTEGETYGAGAF